MKLLFLGTSEFAVPPLEALAASSHEVLLVVTQPDRPAGRGRRMVASAVKQMATSLGLKVYQPEKINTREAREIMGDLAADVAVVASFGQILRPRLLAIPALGCLNIHASLLPRHRGASPIAGAILSGDRKVGVTIMKMDEGLDTGPTALSKSLDADSRETAGQLHDRLAGLGAGLIVDALDCLAANDLEFKPQQNEDATYCGLLTKEDGVLDFELSAEDLDRHVRAFSPWPGAWSFLAQGSSPTRLIFEGADVVDGENPGAKPGEVCAAGRDGIVIACGSGFLRVTQVKPAGSRSMTAGEFLNGTAVVPGDQFGSVS